MKSVHRFLFFAFEAPSPPPPPYKFVNVDLLCSFGVAIKGIKPVAYKQAC